tara:strand:- start:27781 stop:27885 length:105 start_codon:yes stop_codon:yes gene_type:complete
MTEKIEQWTVVQDGKPDFTFTIKDIPKGDEKDAN